MTAFIDYTVFQNRYSFSVSYCRESYEKYYTFKKNVIKIIILFYLIKYFPDNLNVICFCNLISLQVWMFLIYLLKRNLFSYWIENDKLLKSERKREIWPFFVTSKNRDLFFLQHSCFIYLLTRRFVVMPQFVIIVLICNICHNL